MTQKSEHRVRANGLEHHVIEWSGAPAEATALLLHGFMDAAATWEKVAVRLAQAGLRVLAPDFRGFGDGPRAPSGCYYHFVDYIADIADIVDAAIGPAPLFLVGHSMGGSAATAYAGAFPERVTKLAVLEGLGPPDNTFDGAPDRMRAWIEAMREVRARGERVVGTEAEAFRRLSANHPNVPEEALRDAVPHLVREAAGGRVAWKADPMHRTHGPVAFFAKNYIAFAKKVGCPVLYVSGGPQGWHPPGAEERLLAFARLERFELPQAGHMMHWTEPAALASALLDFWRSPAA